MFELGKISRNPELTGTQELLRGYWRKRGPGIHGSKLEMQACVSGAGLEPLLLLKSEPNLIRTDLAEAREATEEL